MTFLSPLERGFRGVSRHVDNTPRPSGTPLQRGLLQFSGCDRGRLGGHLSGGLYVANQRTVAYIDSVPKLRHYDHLNTARFVTFSCYRRLPLLTSDLVIQTVIDELVAVRTRHLFRLLGYVIMPEHVHLVIHPRPESKLGLVIAEFKSRSAARIIAAAKTHRKRWASPAFDSAQDDGG